MKIKLSKKFNKDLERIKANSKPSTWNRIKKRITIATNCIVDKEPLPADFKDHEITKHKRYGNCRDCHILGDLVMLYRVERGEVEILSLMRLDTHGDLDL